MLKKCQKIQWYAANRDQIPLSPWDKCAKHTFVDGGAQSSICNMWWPQIYFTQISPAVSGTVNTNICLVLDFWIQTLQIRKEFLNQCCQSFVCLGGIRAPKFKLSAAPYTVKTNTQPYRSWLDVFNSLQKVHYYADIILDLGYDF